MANHCRQVWLPHEVAHAYQAWLQELKHIKAIFVSNTFNRGYWEDQGYNWFGGS